MLESVAPNSFLRATVIVINNAVAPSKVTLVDLVVQEVLGIIVLRWSPITPPPVTIFIQRFLKQPFHHQILSEYHHPPPPHCHHISSSSIISNIIKTVTISNNNNNIIPIVPILQTTPSQTQYPPIYQHLR